MAKRKRVKLTEEEPKNSYFTSAKENLQFVSTGCVLFDCALGGGYPLGRMVNIVGDKSTAKTGLSTEAIINFLIEYPNGRAAYRETEGAYDVEYAEAMGAPIDKIDFGDLDDPMITVEAFDKDLKKFIDGCIKDDVPGIYIVDSFDSLSDEAEMSRELDKGTFAGEKQKKIGVMFRKLNKKIEKSKVLLIIVSQVREIIGVTFGEKYRRGGGKALDFYASQIPWLAHTGILKRTVKKVERPYGISIKAKVKKNKVGFPFREAEFDFIFGFGVDDVGASVNWLHEIGRLKDLGYSAKNKGEAKKVADGIKDLTGKDYKKAKRKLDKHVRACWNEIEEGFIPKRGKYR